LATRAALPGSGKKLYGEGPGIFSGPSLLLDLFKQDDATRSVARQSAIGRGGVFSVSLRIILPIHSLSSLLLKIPVW
jgi:hypothetical protein